MIDYDKPLSLSQDLIFPLSFQDEGKRDPTTCFEASKTWYDFTQLSYLFVTVKWIITLSYLFKVALFPWVILLAGITTPEIIFKFYMMVTVYSFMKDLKQSLKYMPKYRFIPIPDIETSGSSRSTLIWPMDMDIEKEGGSGLIDINANDKLLP